MSNISSEKIKTLREKTGAGIMDCKNALVESSGDVELAIDWLRKKGIAKANKKSSRVAAEGLVGLISENKLACLIEVNSETDFVAKNLDFQNFIEQLLKLAIKKKYVDNQAECNNNNYLTNEIKTFNFNSLVINLIIIGIAVLIGFLIKNVLLAAADLFSKDVSILLKSFPTFPLCMIGGFIVQKFSEKMKTSKFIEYNQIQRIQNIALDVLILAAISTISLDVVNSNLLAFCILVLGGVVWNIFCVLVLARRIFNDAWFERSIAEMGQSMGVTATGLLLLRTVDPNCKTKAASAFASKQLLHEPFMGGGLWTGMAIPMLVIYGGWQVFIITIIVITAWLLYLIFSEKN